MLTPAQSIAEHLGKEVSYDGYPGQCLSWVKQFMQDTQGFTPPGKVTGAIGGALDYYNDFTNEVPLSTYYELVANDHNDANQLPSEYDIVVWGSNVPGSDGFGHIAVYSTGNSAGFTSYDQNWGGNQTVHAVNHVWGTSQGTILGWLHPKTASVPAPTPPPAPSTPVASTANTLTLPAKNADGTADNEWRLYNENGPYNTAAAVHILDPAKYGGLTYKILGTKGQGIYLISPQDWPGTYAVWTKSTNAVIS